MSVSRSRVLLVAAFAASAWLSTATACAQPADVEALYRQGTELRTRHQDAEALEVYRRAYELAHEPRAMAQIGLAEAALGRWVDAEVHVQAALAVETDRWLRRNRAALEGALRTIREHLGSLEVVCATPGAEVWVRDQRLATLPMTQPLRVVAGTLAFEVRAPGHAAVTRSATVPVGGLARETVDLLPVQSAPATAPVAEPPRTPTATPAAAAPHSAPVAAPPAQPPVPPPAPAPEGRPGGTQRALGWVSAVGAGVALAGGVTALVLRGSEVDAYNADTSCPGFESPMQPAACTDRINAADTLQALSIAGFVAGGVLAATSVVVFVTAPSGSRERSPTAFACGVGPGDLGVSCRMGF